MLILDSTIKPAVQRLAIAKAGDCGELREGHFAPAVVNSNTTSSVVRLLARSGPLDVTRFVISVIVYAFQGVSRTWARPHILKERREVIQPAFTDFNTAPAIAMKKLIIGVSAAGLHALPRIIFGSAIRLAVDLACLRRARFLQTAAAVCLPTPEVARKGNGVAAAHALAVPAGLSRRAIFRPAGNCQSPESGPRQINHLHRRNIT